jgi:hypothetical protein
MVGASEEQFRAAPADSRVNLRRMTVVRTTIGLRLLSGAALLVKAAPPAAPWCIDYRIARLASELGAGPAEEGPDAEEAPACANSEPARPVNRPAVIPPTKGRRNISLRFGSMTISA